MCNISWSWVGVASTSLYSWRFSLSRYGLHPQSQRIFESRNPLINSLIMLPSWWSRVMSWKRVSIVRIVGHVCLLSVLGLRWNEEFSCFLKLVRKVAMAYCRFYIRLCDCLHIRFSYDLFSQSPLSVHTKRQIWSHRWPNGIVFNVLDLVDKINL